MAEEQDRYKKLAEQFNQSHGINTNRKPVQPLSEGQKKANKMMMNPMKKLARKLMKSQTSATAKGQLLAKKVIGPEGLERLGTDPEVQEVLARKKQISEEGISQAEQEALRTKMARQMMQAEQTAGLRLGGALGGAQGAAAAAQQRSLMAQGMQARAGIERDIFLAQEQAKRTGLESYASALGEVKTFDIGQAAKERDIMQSSIMGYEQMASAERAAQAQTEAAKAAVPKRRKFLGLF